MTQLICLLFILLSFAACGKNGPQPLIHHPASAGEVERQETRPVPTNPPADKPQATISIAPSSRKLKWENNYSGAILEELDRPEVEGLLSTKISSNDVNELNCTNFNELTIHHKKIFLTVFIAAIAEAESDFRVGIKTRNHGDNTINVGLLQIDEQAARNHTRHSLGNIAEDDLLNPALNLKVGVHILKNQVLSKVARSRLLPEKSYYWQVLTEKKRLLKSLRLNRNNLPFCSGGING